MRRRLVWLVLSAVLLLPMSAAAQDVVEYYGTDALGSVRIVFDANGNIVGRMDYGPFGEQVTISTVGHKSYAGLFRDGEAGLDYAEARSYQVRTGRFNAPDPVYAGLFQPQAWNRYAYALNNPLSFVDPTGLAADSCTTTETWVQNGDSWSLNTTVRCKDNTGGGGGGGGFWADLSWLLGTWFDRLTNTSVVGAPDESGSTGASYTASRTAQNVDTGTLVAAAILPIATKALAGKVAGAVAGKAAVEGVSASLPVLRISAQQFPKMSANVVHALRAGHPDILTYTGASTANRASALHGVPSVPGFSRDEYPFASTLQGGAGAWVGHIPIAEQNAQGALIANFIRANGLTPGSRYRVAIVP